MVYETVGADYREFVVYRGNSPLTAGPNCTNGCSSGCGGCGSCGSCGNCGGGCRAFADLHLLRRKILEL